MQRDDFENRLGQGLKRWAEHGEPTLDLAATVLELAGPGATEPAQPELAVQLELTVRPGQPPRSRRWLLGPVAAAAALLLAVLTFPAWAGAAASWPLVGPVVTEIILKDAGLAWAYDMGLIGESAAEVREGAVSFRVLGVMADARRTTVIYQITGLPRSSGREEPARSRPPSLLDGRPDSPPFPGIKVDGEGTMTQGGPPVETPIGLVGTVSTLPLSNPTAELTVMVRLGEKALEVKVPASRTETDRYSREVVVNQSQEIDGITMTVEAVIFTPAETVIRYRRDGPMFYGPIQWDGKAEAKHLLVNGKRVEVRNWGGGFNGREFISFPPTSGRLQFVVPVEVKPSPVDVRWELSRPGETVWVGENPVTLVEVRKESGVIDLTFTNPTSESFMGLAGIELVDGSGDARPVAHMNHGESNYQRDGTRTQHLSVQLPEGFDPVAIRATNTGTKVVGPWIFDLPR